VAGGQERVYDALIDLASLRLAVRLVRATYFNTLIPGEPQPPKCIQKLVIALFAIAFLIGVFNTKDEGSPSVPGIGPVEQRCAH
jgi:hypothetical protein